jgi:MFS transporter, DHA2 family, multidrug resistance protein
VPCRPERSAVNDTTREVGGTLGVAIIGSVLNSGYGSHVVSGLTALGGSAAAGHLAAQSVTAGMTVAARFPAPLVHAATAAVQAAFITGVHRGSLVAAGTSLAAALVALVFVPARPAPGTDVLSRTEAADRTVSTSTTAV